MRTESTAPAAVSYTHLAVRVHGGGFGGTVQAFVPADLLAEFQTRTEAVLGAGSCHVLSIRPAGGVRLA